MRMSSSDSLKTVLNVTLLCDHGDIYLTWATSASKIC